MRYRWGQVIKWEQICTFGLVVEYMLATHETRVRSVESPGRRMFPFLCFKIGDRWRIAPSIAYEDVERALSSAFSRIYNRLSIGEFNQNVFFSSVRITLVIERNWQKGMYCEGRHVSMCGSELRGSASTRGSSASTLGSSADHRAVAVSGRR